ncbi:MULTISPECIES: NAD(+) synthase [unclassified Myxococcus]|uniref:NAD(+) synthase n=1 Tax=Myxococcus TaxID=32 RepID=UPI001CBD4475|nr:MULTISPECIES: NAD(+) synthase [unclassified Myxococcus]MBZ4396509.1 NAD(+) synthase [Myxococcus sp. AS-1-15]MBZ4411782.1 NAD(+) synthase [Myxococcus sp. XM-1-1-1]BDT38022.1 NAD() synthase [Myxococcus sp. MH1]
MRLVKVGIASVNTVVGAFVRNTDRALALAKRMAEDGVTVGVFQEQLIAGYPAEDMVQWQGFIDRQWPELERFANQTASLPTVFLVGVGVALQGQRLNCAAVVAGGRVLGLVPKEKLPTYSVFYEARTFGRGQPGMAEVYRGVPLGDYLFQFDFGLIAPEVCEDIWSADGPMRRRTYSGAELVINLSASPFRLGFVETRRELIATRAADHQCTIAYCNAVGSNDGLIFDGGGFLNQNGRHVMETPRFQEGYAAAVVDLDRTLRLRGEATTWRVDRESWLSSGGKSVPVLDCTKTVATRREALTYPVPPHRSFFLPAPDKRRPAREALCEDILDALALGVGDYFEKTRAFKVLGIALSGGRDSLLTLLIAHRYAKRARPDNPGSLIQAFYMPSRFSSDSTREAAETIARELGVAFQVVSIDEAFERERAVAETMLGGAPVTAITEQNIQARLRAQRMWNWSNSCGGLFLQTGNMSEKSVGYTTIGGDLMGALAVISNVPKTVVMYLLDYLQETTGHEGIRKVLAKPAGPELAHNQVGEEELMPFPILDACFYLFAAEKLTPAEMLQALTAMFPEVDATRLAGHVDKFVRLFNQSIYKWVQSPLSLHIGNLDLDRERALQLPVVTGSEWLRAK